MNIEQHVCEVIEAAGHAVLGTNMFKGLVRDNKFIPADCVFVHIYDGDVEPYFGGSDAADLFEDRIQIRVRSQSRETGFDQAKQIFTAVHKQDRDSDNYAGWLASLPIYISLDTKGRHEWAINMTVTYEE